MNPVVSSRRSRLLKWASMLLAIAFATLWAASGGRELAHVRLGACSFSLNRGEATALYWKRDPDLAFRCRIMSHADIAAILNDVARKPSWIDRWNWSLPELWMKREPGAATASARLPLWMAILAVSSLATLLVLTDRRAIARKGTCPTCSYRLSGLPPNSPCPECGHAPGGSGGVVAKPPPHPGY